MSEGKKRPQLSVNELYQVNWFLGILLALLSIWTAFYLQYAVLSHVVLTSVVVTIAFFRPQLTVFIPRIFWQAVPFLLVIVLAIDLHLSSEPVPALIRLNILLILYRCMAFRKKREDLQLIVLCLFLLIIAGVLTVALTFVFQIVLFTGVAMAFLFNITLMEDVRNDLELKEVWRDFTWRRFLRKIASLCDGGSLLVAGLTFGSVIGISVLLFLVIPRFDISNRIPFLNAGRTSQTGFSEDIRFGDVTDIRTNSRVALRVEVSSPDGIPAAPYWRMLVLDDYSNGSFHISQAVRSNIRSGGKVSEISFNDELIGATEAPDVSNTWTFYLEGGVARFLPFAGRFQRVRFQESRNMNYLTPFHVFYGSRVNSSMFVYQVENMEFSGVSPDPNFPNDKLEFEYYPEIDQFFDHEYKNYPDTTVTLRLSRADRSYLEELAEEIRQGEELSNAEFAARASHWLQSRHTYSTNYSLPRGEEDHVVRWLRSRQPGHCEAFAGALILLCRSVGIPARVVTGFKGGSWNTYENYFMVRYSDAHAWVEIFDGEGSWRRFDPTPGSTEEPAATVDSMAAGTAVIDSSFAAYLDSLRVVWYRRIVSFDQKSQFELWATVREAWSRVDVRKWISDVKALAVAWFGGPWDSQRLAEVIGLFGAGGLFCFLVAFCVRRDRMLLFTLGRNRGDPIRRKAGNYLQQLQRFHGAGFGVSEEARYRELVATLQRLRFGPAIVRTVSEETFRRARAFMRERR